MLLVCHVVSSAFGSRRLGFRVFWLCFLAFIWDLGFDGFVVEAKRGFAVSGFSVSA